MDDETLDSYGDWMKEGTSKTALRFQIFHRIFRRLANSPGDDALDFFKKQWKTDPILIIGTMGVVCSEVDCERFMEDIEEQKDKNNINENAYLFLCNTIKTIHEYKNTKAGVCVADFLAHRLVG